MTTIVGLLGAIALGFGLGWLSRPRYSASMSRAGQVALVAGVALVAALAFGYAFGERGWPLVIICLGLPLAFVAPYAGGFVRDRG